MLGEYGIAAGANAPAGAGGGGFGASILGGDPLYLGGAVVLLVLAFLWFLAR